MYSGVGNKKFVPVWAASLRATLLIQFIIKTKRHDIKEPTVFS